MQNSKLSKRHPGGEDTITLIPASPKQKTNESPRTTTESKLIRLLLIEDDDINRLLLSDYLNYAGYQVFSLADGSNFFQALSNFNPDLILLDLKLPGIDGYGLLEQLRKSPEWHHVPVVVVSAFAFGADRQRALDLGARKYFVKPVKLLTLRQAIQEELGIE